MCVGSYVAEHPFDNSGVLFGIGGSGVLGVVGVFEYETERAVSLLRCCGRMWFGVRDALSEQCVGGQHVLVAACGAPHGRAQVEVKPADGSAPAAAPKEEADPGTSTKDPPAPTPRAPA